MHNILSYKTKFGWISIKEKNNSITSVSFNKLKNTDHSSILKKFKKNLNEYFEKKTKKLSPNILLEGTDLQKKIWKELKKIPYGKTKSYGEIAKIVKTSPRYVGNVCGQNKHLLVIPCHRVIRSDGNLGGFSGLGGLALKKKLLNMEKK